MVATMESRVLTPEEIEAAIRRAHIERAKCTAELCLGAWRAVKRQVVERPLETIAGTAIGTVGVVGLYLLGLFVFVAAK